MCVWYVLWSEWWWLQDGVRLDFYLEGFGMLGADKNQLFVYSWDVRGPRHHTLGGLWVYGWDTVEFQCNFFYTEFKFVWFESMGTMKETMRVRMIGG